jgi:hypothetical protein
MRTFFIILNVLGFIINLVNFSNSGDILSLVLAGVNAIAMVFLMEEDSRQREEEDEQPKDGTQ